MTKPTNNPTIKSLEGINPKDMVTTCICGKHHEKDNSASDISVTPTPSPWDVKLEILLGDLLRDRSLGEDIRPIKRKIKFLISHQLQQAILGERERILSGIDKLDSIMVPFDQEDMDFSIVTPVIRRTDMVGLLVNTTKGESLSTPLASSKKK